MSARGRKRAVNEESTEQETKRKRVGSTGKVSAPPAPAKAESEPFAFEPPKSVGANRGRTVMRGKRRLPARSASDTSNVAASSVSAPAPTRNGAVYAPKKTDAKKAAASKKTAKKKGGEEPKPSSVRSKSDGDQMEVDDEDEEKERPEEQLWRNVFYAGTEWEQYTSIFSREWDFRHLQKSLLEGELSKAFPPFTAHLFGMTEPTLLPVDGGEQVILVPVIVVVLSKLPPPSKFGLTSVQAAKEEIVPFRRMHATWVPYYPAHSLGTVDPRRLPQARVFYLHSSMRKSAIGNLNEERKRQWDYILPWLFKLDQEEDPITTVNPCITVEGKTIPLEFDYSMDDLDDRTKELLDAHGLDEKHREEVRETIRTAANEQKKSNRAVVEARKKEIEAFSDAEKDSLQTMKCYKFYPLNFQMSPSPFINRYYGKAYKVFHSIEDESTATPALSAASAQ